MNQLILECFLELIPQLQQLYPNTNIPWKVLWLLLQGMGSIQTNDPQQVSMFVTNLRTSYPQLPPTIFPIIEVAIPKIAARVQQKLTQSSYQYQRPITGGYYNPVAQHNQSYGTYNPHNP